MLPDGTVVGNFKLAFLDAPGAETRYRGLKGDQLCLVREARGPYADRLRWEHVLLERLSHPVLPELVEGFEHEQYYYLATAFPQGMRLDQKVAFQNLSQPALVSMGLVLYELLVLLDGAGVHLELQPASLIRTPAGRLLLMDLKATGRSQRYPGGTQVGTLAEDLAALARCLQFWIPEPASGVRKLIEALAQGKVERRAFDGLTDADTLAAMLPAGAPLKRVPTPDGSGLTCLPPGTLLGGYEVTYHARGGMSLCYLGKLGSDVRFLKEARADQPEATEALRREFGIMKGLRHPSILRAHQIFELGGYLYLVTDFIEGATLEALVKAEKPSEPQLLDWARQLCEGLSYLHEREPPVIYRDLKPANVLRSGGGRLYLIDFGLARTYRAGQLKDTQALGTFSTASPEHFTGQTDPRSDIFSLGATLFLLAVPGYKPPAPFRYPALRTQRADVSEEFEKLVARCMQQAPEARWQSCAELAAEVRRLLQPYQDQFPTAEEESDWLEELRFLPNLGAQIAAGARQLADSGPGAFARLAQECENPGLRRLWDSLARESQGKPLAAALRGYPTLFPPVYLELVERNQLGEAAALLEKEERARRTHTAPGGEDLPLGAARPRRVGRRGALVTGVGLLSFAGGAGSVYQAGQPLWLPALAGVGASLGVAVAATFVIALRDARQLRTRGKAQNLVEDAWTSYQLGEVDKAEEDLGKALTMARDVLGATDLTTLTSLHSLANLCRQRKAWDKAEAYYVQALAIYDRALPPNAVARANLHHHRALNYLGMKNQGEALAEFERSLAIWNGHAEENPLGLAEVQFAKARLHFDRDENEAALELFGRSLELQYAAVGLKSPLVHTTLSYLTRVYVRLKKFKESEKHLVTLLSEGSQARDPNYPALAEANLDLGLIRLEENRLTEAEPYFLRALQMLQHYVGPNDRLLRRVLEGYRRILGERAELDAGSMKLLSLFMGEREKLRRSLEKHPEWINARDKTGWGPIQWATFIGREDIVRLLLNRGADPGYDSSYVMGPLHVACAWNRPEAMFALLEKDPDVSASGPGGWTPAFWCALTGQNRLLEHLLRRGAKVQDADDQGRTALHVAASNNHLRVVAALLGAGADVNCQATRGGETPLHLAAERGHLAICECLIFNKAQLALKDEAGQTALELAEQNGHKLVARAIRRHMHEGFGRDSEEKPLSWRDLVGVFRKSQE